ncbi:EscT/YscT/HrcT family type III secretion system export apparatus protein [Burkholderia pyrrocinia]
MHTLFDMVSLLALLVARGYGVLFMVPPLLRAGQGWLVRLPIALALSLPAANLVSTVSIAHLNVAAVALIAAFEFGVGLIVGALFLPLFAVPRSVGALIDLQAGLQSIQLFDPGSAERSTTLFADLFEQIVWVMFISVGGLVMMAEAYALSQQVWPMGQLAFPEPARLVSMAQEGYRAMGRTTFMVVAPFAIVLFMLDYAMALIGRSAPQLNVLTNSIAIKITFVILVFVVMLGPLMDASQTTIGAWMDGAIGLYRTLQGKSHE